MNLLIGADPEVFVYKNGSVVSGHGLVPGTKRKPFKVDNGAVQVDGMALEFNIDPAASEEEFSYNITSVLSTLKSMVPEFELLPEPYVEFTQEYMDTQPAVAKRMGCDPDFDAWGMCVNQSPSSASLARTGGGHIHIGWTEGADYEGIEHFMECCEVVKALDSTLYIASKVFDSDERRRSLYGNIGAFRPKSYGVEYRVLSNAWLKDVELIKYIYRFVTDVLYRFNAGKVDMLTKEEISLHTQTRESATQYLLSKGLEVPPHV